MKSARRLAILLVVLAALSAAQVAAQQSATPVPDPLARELERCKQLNERAASDDRCTAAYKESLQRFLAPPPDYQPAPSRINPDTPASKLVEPGQR